MERTIADAGDVFKHGVANAHTGEYDGLPKILQHEAKSRAGVGQAVRAMENDKAVKELVISIYRLRDLDPAFAVDGRGIQKRFELQHGISEKGSAKSFPHPNYQFALQVADSTRRWTCLTRLP